MINQKLLALGLLWLAGVPWPSRQDSAAPPDADSPTYRSLRDAVYNCEPAQRIEDLYLRAREALAAAELPAQERGYRESRLEQLLVRFYSSRGDRKRAAEHSERGLTLIEQALAEGSFSEGWRLKGDLLGQLCLLKDVGFLLANGLKAEGYAREALRLDPGNAAAQIIVASRKIYPPALLGGNPRLGLELMREALAMRPADPGDLFNIYSGLGLACRKLRDFPDARLWFSKALELFPGNTFVRREYAQLASVTVPR